MMICVELLIHRRNGANIGERAYERHSIALSVRGEMCEEAENIVCMCVLESIGGTNNTRTKRFENL